MPAASERTRRLWPLALVGGCALGLALAACAPATQARPKSGAGNLRPASAAALIAALAARARQLKSLSSPAVMEYANGKQLSRTREVITASGPDRMRLEALSPFGVALVVATEGGQIQVFDPAHNTLYRGRADAATLSRFARIPIDAGAAVALLMGLAPRSAELRPDSVVRRGELTTIAGRLTDGSLEELSFGGGLLRSLSVSDPSGRRAYSASFSDYRDIGGFEFPYRIAATFFASGTRITLTYARPIINESLPEAAFILRPGPGTRELALDAPAPG